MDSDALVTEQIESGRTLADELRASKFDVEVAFWAKPSDDESWLLYLVTPLVDQQGSPAAYRLLHPVVWRVANSWIDPLDVRVLGTADPMAVAVRELTKPRVVQGPFALPNPKPYAGATRVSGRRLGGIEVDAAYIYPPFAPTPTA